MAPTRIILDTDLSMGAGADVDDGFALALAHADPDIQLELITTANGNTDFDSQLDATRMMLSVLSDGIRRSALSQKTPPWWNQSALEGILNSYDRSYSRLGAIFVEISRQRSSATALRAYIRKRRYDGDISYLRLSIDTYTSALQLPVLIQTIQGSTLAVPQPPTGDAAVSFDELGRSEDAQVELDAAKQKEKLDMENDTRATLGVLKGLMGHVKDYASTFVKGEERPSGRHESYSWP
ncbi:hypothetical protein LCI18_000771 [Fusarium solani-melongenae]|uniref:Uncharacterized protein n=1 Tax=Fusarium solani subsp. cucurbitae TaxID=2747967 RepID=A0ACD3YLR2_FUSSC|nr:hypothetical protein LCI18_000771 [Fusarium solani-melongenae]